jgi:hypothetical protein
MVFRSAGLHSLGVYDARPPLSSAAAGPAGPGPSSTRSADHSTHMHRPSSGQAQGSSQQQGGRPGSAGLGSASRAHAGAAGEAAAAGAAAAAAAQGGTGEGQPHVPGGRRVRAAPLPASNPGYRLLRKAGWREGTGLGAAEQVRGGVCAAVLDVWVRGCIGRLAYWKCVDAWADGRASCPSCHGPHTTTV